jgi:hypothetical protein
MEKIKKIIIFLVIFSFILPQNFSKAALAPVAPIISVPVFDESAGEALGNIHDVLMSIEEELKQMKKNTDVIPDTLKTNIEQTMLPKIQNATEYLQKLEFLNELNILGSIGSEEASNLQNKKILEELNTGVANETVQEIKDYIKNSYGCLDPEIKQNFVDYIASMIEGEDVDFNEDYFSAQIPECSGYDIISQSPQKSNLLSFVLKPFQFNLAQTNPEISPPSITITKSAYSLTAKKGYEYYYDLISRTKSIWISKKTEAEKSFQEAASSSIGTPVCTNGSMKAETLGGPGCTEFKPGIKKEEVEKILQQAVTDIAKNNPSQAILNSILNSFGFQSNFLDAIKNLYSQSGFFMKIAIRRELYKFIRKQCENFEKSKAVKSFDECMKAAEELLERELYEADGNMSKTLDFMAKAYDYLDNSFKKNPRMYAQIDWSVCPKAGAWFNKVEERIKRDLKGFKHILDEFKKFRDAYKSKVESLVQSLENIDRVLIQMQRVLRDFGELADALKNLVGAIQSALKLLGINVYVPDFINNITSFLNKISSYAENIYKIRQTMYSIFNPLFDLLDFMDKLLGALNNVYYALSKVLYSAYKIAADTEKLAAYTQYAVQGDCYGGGKASGKKIGKINHSAKIVLIKDTSVAKLDINKTPETSNSFYSLKNLFKPKIIEITNEK